jgi:uroporphyrinogen-III synthase
MTSVLVVRKFDNFSRILGEHGVSVINCPTIETFRRENLEDLRAKISARDYDGIFLTSRAATEIALSELFCRDFNYRGKIYVLGKSSFELLKETDLDLFFDAAANTARELLAAIPREELENKRFLFIRGERSLLTVPEFLEKVGAVDETIVYETRPVAVDGRLKKEIEAGSRALLCVCFFSPSGAESFLAQFGAGALGHAKIAAIGKTTADFLVKQNLKVDFTPTKANSEDFAAELVDYLKASSLKSQAPGRGDGA